VTSRNALMDTVPVERINAEARDVQFGRTVLTIIAALFFAIGWIAARTLGVLWLALAWSATAIKVGWQAGRAPTARR
jgi:hypothetical protein